MVIKTDKILLSIHLQISKKLDQKKKKKRASSDTDNRLWEHAGRTPNSA